MGGAELCACNASCVATRSRIAHCGAPWNRLHSMDSCTGWLRPASSQGSSGVSRHEHMFTVSLCFEGPLCKSESVAFPHGQNTENPILTSGRMWAMCIQRSWVAENAANLAVSEFPESISDGI
jgi:hypothetical protein